MTFAEYIAEERPKVALLAWQRDWVKRLDALLAFDAGPKHRGAGKGFVLSLLRDYMRFTR